MAKNPNPNSLENKMKIKEKRKRSKSEDEVLATEEALEIEEEKALEKDILNYKSFESMNLSQPTLKAINDMEFNNTTELQARCIPLLMEGKNVVASANTASEKTVAFFSPCCGVAV